MQAKRTQEEKRRTLLVAAHAVAVAEPNFHAGPLLFAPVCPRLFIAAADVADNGQLTPTVFSTRRRRAESSVEVHSYHIVQVL